MRDKLVQSASLLAAIAIVGGVLYLLLDKAAPIVAVTPQPPAVIAPRPAAPRPYETPAIEERRDTASGVYRCERGGSIVYSDTPCQGGRVVDIQITRGFEGERLTQMASTSRRVEEAGAPASASSAEKSQEARNAALCASIVTSIEGIDAAARAGGSIQYMEDLKERRRKLVEQRQQHRC